MTLDRTPCLAVALLVLGLVLGCGSNSSLAVHGKVTLDGTPVEEGSIAFLPPSGEGAKAAAVVKQGAYALGESEGLPPGRYRVEVSWRKPTGRKIPSADPGMTIDETREAIPEKYNVQSTLAVELKAGQSEYDFALTTK